MQRNPFTFYSACMVIRRYIKDDPSGGLSGLGGLGLTIFLQVFFARPKECSCLLQTLVSISSIVVGSRHLIIHCYNRRAPVVTFKRVVHTISSRVVRLLCLGPMVVVIRSSTNIFTKQRD